MIVVTKFACGNGARWASEIEISGMSLNPA
jgi:hypothetical protein